MPLGPISGKSPQAFFGFYLAREKTAAERCRAALWSQRAFESARPRAADSRGLARNGSALERAPSHFDLPWALLPANRWSGDGPDWARAERGAGGLVFPIAFLSLMDGLETILSRRERRVR